MQSTGIICPASTVLVPWYWYCTVNKESLLYGMVTEIRPNSYALCSLKTTYSTVHHSVLVPPTLPIVPHRTYVPI